MPIVMGIVHNVHRTSLFSISNLITKETRYKYGVDFDEEINLNQFTKFFDNYRKDRFKYKIDGVKVRKNPKDDGTVDIILLFKHKPIGRKEQEYVDGFFNARVPIRHFKYTALIINKKKK